MASSTKGDNSPKTGVHMCGPIVGLFLTIGAWYGYATTVHDKTAWLVGAIVLTIATVIPWAMTIMSVIADRQSQK